MTDYIILVNPDFYEKNFKLFELPIDISGYDTIPYLGVPILLDKWLSFEIGYVICQKIGHTYVPIPKKKRVTND